MTSEWLAFDGTLVGAIEDAAATMQHTAITCGRIRVKCAVDFVKYMVRVAFFSTDDASSLLRRSHSREADCMRLKRVLATLCVSAIRLRQPAAASSDSKLFSTRDASQSSISQTLPVGCTSIPHHLSGSLVAFQQMLHTFQDGPIMTVSVASKLTQMAEVVDQNIFLLRLFQG